MLIPDGSTLPYLISFLPWHMLISPYYSYHPDRYWYLCDHMCIASYDTTYSDCMKRGVNMCICPPQDFTMNYIYTMYLSILYWPPTIQLLIDTYFLHAIHCSKQLEHFGIFKSYWRWSCGSDGLRSSATDGYVFLNYICLSIICLSYARLVLMWLQVSMQNWQWGTNIKMLGVNRWRC